MLAALEPLDSEPGKTQSFQQTATQPHFEKHSAHLSLSSLLDHQFNDISIGLNRFRRPSRTVFEHRAALEMIDLRRGDNTIDNGSISLIHAPRRVEESMSQLPIVGEQKNSESLTVEPSYRIDSSFPPDRRCGEEIHDCRAPLWVRDRRDIPLRLVQQEVE